MKLYQHQIAQCEARRSLVTFGELRKFGRN